MKYPVLEIFQSIQGEGSHVGRYCNFIRLAGCPNNCTFCDTDLSAPIIDLSAEQIAEQMKPGIPVVITGGEPLMHNIIPLCECLLNSLTNCQIHVETSGSVCVCPEVPPYVEWLSVSPKKGHPIVPAIRRHADDAKWLVPEWSLEEIDWGLATYHFLQPVNFDRAINRVFVVKAVDMLSRAVVPKDKILALSLQIHKVIGVR